MSFQRPIPDALRSAGPPGWRVRLRQAWRRWRDGRCERDWSEFKLGAPGAFPVVPELNALPAECLDRLRRDGEELIAGQWRFFGRLPVKVDDPPHWHRDYLADREVRTTRTGFELSSRAAPEGVDRLMIKELNRWQPLTRLAMVARAFEDQKAALKVVVWLEDWVRHNPPFQGWNWTDTGEAARRLIQFVWIDAMLCDGVDEWRLDGEWETLRYEILAPHLWFIWRHRATLPAGSRSVLELSALLAAVTRWPAMGRWGAPLSTLRPAWDESVLGSFHADGGPRDQSLPGHLLALESGWIALAALRAGELEIPAPVEQRLGHAAEFYVAAQSEAEPWDYGEGDGAMLLPFWHRPETAASEWRDWLDAPAGSPALNLWWGGVRSGARFPPRSVARRDNGIDDVSETAGDWSVYPRCGIAVWRERGWFLRWDLSGLGEPVAPSTAHLDALHLSIWRDHRALVIDPGTGSADLQPERSDWVAGAAAHNGPVSEAGLPVTRTAAGGWSAAHSIPAWRPAGTAGLLAEWFLPDGVLKRSVLPRDDGQGMDVQDDYLPNEASGAGEFTVRWTFAPGTGLQLLNSRRFRVAREGVVLVVELSADWDTVIAFGLPGENHTAISTDDQSPAGQVSPVPGRWEAAPGLLLTGYVGQKPCLFQTSFLASRPA